MAKKTAASQQKAVQFGFSKKAIKQPRRIFLNKRWVAIGGEIVIPPKPPRPAVTFPMPTAEEMAELYVNMPHLIVKL